MFQWKYDVDGPWWRKLYFRYIYLPFARFSFHVVRIVPFERLEPDGSLSWKHEQGVWLRCEDAEREAARYPFGGWRIVRLNSPEAAVAVFNHTHFPNSDKWHEYEQRAAKEQVAASRGLQDALAESRRVVEQFRASSHA